jgi:hypothetical protein
MRTLRAVINGMAGILTEVISVKLGMAIIPESWPWSSTAPEKPCYPSIPSSASIITT